MTRQFIHATLALAAAAVSAHGSVSYYVSPDFSSPTGVSNNGVAVGLLGSAWGSWNPQVNSAASSIGGVASGNAGISADGRYIGASAAGPDGKTEMSRYDRDTGTWTNLGGGGGFSSATRSVGWNISRDGSTVVGYGYGTYTGSGTGTFTGVVPLSNKNGVMTNYAQVAAGTGINRLTVTSRDGTASAGQMRLPNGSGSITGIAHFNNSTTGTPLYVSGTSFGGEPGAMSGDGTIIGGSGVAATVDSSAVPVRRPYLYNTTNASTLLLSSIAGLNGNVIPANATRIDGFVTGMSDDGNTVVGFFRASASVVFVDKVWGFVWNASTGIQTIEDFMSAAGASIPSNQYLVPMSISPDGGTIAGYQYTTTPTMVTTGFMVTNIPAPSAAAALAMFGLMGSRRRR